MIFAAIDIGSNAVRLLFSIVTESKGVVHFNKATLVRMPVRLGTDAFVHGELSSARIDALVTTLKAYKLLIDVYGVDEYMACATSALREVRNGEEVISRVKKEANLDLELIDGKTEAELIFKNHAEEALDIEGDFLYIDVGGGSTELTLFAEGEKVASHSFRIGTIRLLENMVEPAEWETLEKWLDENTAKCEKLTAIGTGGNINKLFKISKRKDNKPLYQNSLAHYLKYLKSYTLEERINELGLRPDRADVIIPATEIYHRIMKWAHIHELYVPKLGLADGMVRHMWEKHKAALTR